MINQKLPMIEQIETAVKDVPGWTPIDQLYTLYNLAIMTSGIKGDILEIGSWCGRSSVVIGQAAKQTGDSVKCIDLFPAKDDWKQNKDGSYSFAVGIQGESIGGYQEQTVWQEPFEKDIAPIYEKYDSVHDVFLKSIKDANLQGIVEGIKGSSDELSTFNKDSYRLAFIDADHSYDAVCKDIENVDNVLMPGGWICFDDASSHYDGVNQAIEEKIIESDRYELAQQMTRKFFIARKRG